MSKFFLTNQESWYNKTKQLVSKSDFSLAFDYAKDGVFAVTTRKLKINNTNAYQNDIDEFAIATGTAIYKESLDYAKLLDSFGDDINEIRANTIGQYAYVIRKGENITIFGDRTAAYDIYYYIGADGSAFISNSLYDMVAAIRDEVTLDEMSVIEYACTSLVLGGHTIFKEINRLNGEEYISVSKAGKYVIKRIPNVSMYPLLSTSAEDAAMELANKLSYKAGVIAKVLGAPTISMTGGLDSRILLASFLKAGVKPKLQYGRSNTYIASPLYEDELVLKKIAEKYNLQYEIQKWDTTNIENGWDRNLKRYGFLYCHWGASEAIFKAYEELDTNAFIFGFGGECYRNSFPLPNHQEPYTIDEITEMYGNHTYMSNATNYQLIPEYKRYINAKLSGVASTYKLDVQSIKDNDAFYYEYEFTKYGASTPPNLLNQMKYTPSLLLESDCIELARISYEELDGARLMLMTMRELCPSIIDIEFFTRCTLHNVDKSTMKLVKANVRDYRRTYIERQLKNIYHKIGKSWMRPLSKIYRKIERKIRPIGDNCYPIATYNMENKKFIQHHVGFVDTRPKMGYVMLNKALDALNFSVVL